jgi:hypothetical protein
MKKKRSPRLAGRSDVPEGWLWVRYWVALRSGHYHYEWLPALVEHGRVQLWGSRCTIPCTAPVLHNALWRGPIEPPPLDEPPKTAVAIEHGGNRRGREEADFTYAERHAMKIRLLAADIVETLFEVGKEVRQGKIRIAELVDRVEELLDDAFGGEGA